MPEIPQCPGKRELTKTENKAHAVMDLHLSEMRRDQLTNLWIVPLLNIFLKFHFGKYFETNS